MAGFLCLVPEFEISIEPDDKYIKHVTLITAETKDPFDRANEVEGYKPILAFSSEPDVIAFSPDASYRKWSYYDKEGQISWEDNEMGYVNICTRMLEEWKKEHVLFNQSDILVGGSKTSKDIKVIIGCRNIVLDCFANVILIIDSSITEMKHGSKVKNLINSQVVSMDGVASILTAKNSHIGVMKDQSEIHTTVGKTTVEIMTNASTIYNANDMTAIFKMQDDSRIIKLTDQSVINTMEGDGPSIWQVDKNATINNMMNGYIDILCSGRVIYMFDGLIGEVYAGGQIFNNVCNGVVNFASMIEDVGCPSSGSITYPLKVYNYEGFIKGAVLEGKNKYVEMLRRPLT